MRPRKRGSKSAGDLFRARLDQIIDMDHALVKLTGRIDWPFFEEAFTACYSERGRPGLPTRLMVDLHILKHMYDLSDEAVCESVEKVYVDKGYRGHGMDRFMVWMSGQRTPSAAIRKRLRRRSAIEPVIGHRKSDGRLDRNVLKGRDGDRVNAILTGAGHNFRLVLAWLARFLLRILVALLSDPDLPRNKRALQAQA